MSRPRGEDGTSLLELLVSSFIFLLLAAILCRFSLETIRAVTYHIEMARLSLDLTIGMDLLAEAVSEAGGDPTGMAFAPGETGIEGISNEPGTDNIRLRMDLPRDCGGRPDDLSLDCPSTGSCNGAGCANGTPWDMRDKNGDETYNLGDPFIRGEAEPGNGVIGDTVPDEDLTFFLDSRRTELRRRLTVLRRDGSHASSTSPMVQNLDPTAGPIFTSADDLVVIRLKGRTATQSPRSGKFGYIELQTSVRPLAARR